MQRFYILTSSILAIGYFRLFHWPKIRQWSVVRQANQNQTEDQILCLSSSKFRRTMSRLKSENVISEIKNIVIWLRDQWSNDLWLIILLGILFKFFFFKLGSSHKSYGVIVSYFITDTGRDRLPLSRNRKLVLEIQYRFELFVWFSKLSMHMHLI